MMRDVSFAAADKIVDDPDLVASLDCKIGHVASDEARAAGDKRRLPPARHMRLMVTEKSDSRS
jgi:hypothetical protein